MQQLFTLVVIVLLLLISGNIVAFAQPTELVVGPTGNEDTIAGMVYWSTTANHDYRFFTADSLQLKIMSGLNNTIQYTIDLLPGEWNRYYFDLYNWPDLNGDGTGDIVLSKSDVVTYRSSFRIVDPVANTTLISFDDPDYEFDFAGILDPGLDGHKNIIVRRTPFPGTVPYHYVVYSTDYSAGIAGTPGLPREIDVRQNFPNPFNPSTRIDLDLPAAGDVRIDIYDVAGARVRTLLNDRFEAGRHTAIWDGTTDQGIRVASGSYYYHVTVNGTARVKKMILLR